MKVARDQPGIMWLPLRTMLITRKAKQNLLLCLVFWLFLQRHALRELDRSTYVVGASFDENRTPQSTYRIESLLDLHMIGRAIRCVVGV